MFYNNSSGLTDREVIESRKKYGNNCLNEVKGNNLFSLFIESLSDPIIKILLVALAIKIVFLFKDFDWYETLGIIIAILIASFISTISEYGSEKAFKKMQEEAETINCKVKRNNKVIVVPITEIVKNDLVILDAGDKIPADGIIIDGEISVDESSLNGETKEQYKRKIENDITDENKVYRGSVVYSKKATMLVTEVGNNTIYGKLFKDIQEDSPASPLKIRLKDLALTISKIGYIGALLVSVSYLFSQIVIKNNFDWNLILITLKDFPLMFSYILYALTISVTIIVVAVPEGLPMMITLVLSSNMKTMLKNNVLVRKLVGIETAGNINILFTDKTGTLTKGKLEVVKVIDGDLNTYDNEFEIEQFKKYHYIFKTSIVNNADCYIDKNQVIGGNITDKALFSFIKSNIEKEKIINTIPFDSNNKYSLSTILVNNKKIDLVKGAKEKIIPYCKYYYDRNGVKKDLSIDKINDYIDSLSSKGIRVIVLAIKDNYYQDFKNMTLVSIIAIKDDIRKETVEGLNLVKSAGIQTVMITGDNKDTAISIGKEISLLNDKDIVITSSELNKMSDDEVKSILPKLKIVARALPNDKTRLVKIARSMDLVVGMTGDGVNDAPALKQADVGFAMGSGTEVSKEAADIVILDDNLLSISKAILYGRTIFKSIRKFIICQLTINLCAIGLSIIGSFIGIDTPVTVIQMLWINMVMDTLTGLAFAFEPPLIEYMKELPKKKNEPIINKYMLQEIFITGIYSFILCIFFLKSPTIFSFYRSNPKYLESAFFGLFIFIDIFNSFNARTTRLNILSNLFKNKIFLIIIFIIVFIQIILIYYGGDLFRTIGLNFKELQLMIILAFSVIPVDFVRKLLTKKGNKTL